MMLAKYRLADIATVFNGKTPSKAEQRETGFPVLKIKDVSETGEFRGTFSSFIDETLANKHSARWIKTGDTLILNAAHNADYVASKLFLASENVEGTLPTGEWLLVRPNPQHIIPEYLHYWLRSSETRKAVRFLVKGIHLYPKDIAELTLRLPPLDEQRRIVDILSRAEGVVRLRREAQKKAAEIIPALFIDMFGDPTANPKGFSMRKVSEFVSRFEGGKNVQAGSENGSPYRILKVSAATSGIYLESESKPAPNGYNPRAAHIIREGDMIFSRANTEELVGATAIVRRTNGKTLLPDKLWRFVWAEDVESTYMHALFQSPYVRRELSKLSTGTSASMRNISQGKLFNLSLPVAPYTGQIEFAERAATIHSIQSQQSAATANAEATFQALIGRAFRSV
jgi:type I restriction enzyme S subunit